MQFLPLKLWLNDKGFTLIEILLAFCLFTVFLVIFSGFIINLSRTVDVYANIIEKNETLLSALDQLKTFIKTGYPVALLQNGSCLQIAMGKNLIEIYPKDSNLLVKHLNTANPILDHCSIMGPLFALEVMENGKIRVQVSLDFLFQDNSQEHLDLQYLSWCEVENEEVEE